MKKLLIVLLVACSMFSFTGCQKKQECDWCGDIKKCQEIKEDGEVMVIICNDCVKEIQEEFY